MDEIASFNQIFAESARAGLHLNSFCQLQNGSFRANFSNPRLGMHYDCAEHERPFDALLKAFIIAFGADQIVRRHKGETDVQFLSKPTDDPLFA